LKILAITNQKGGVGKTTTAINLSACLAIRGVRVLLADLDPQANATTGSGIDKQRLGNSIYQMLLGLSSMESVKITTSFGYDLLPSNRDLGGAEIELIEMPRREYRLDEALSDKLGAYDLVLLDCPPALNLLTLNGLSAASGVIIPMQCEYYALEGLSDLVSTLRKVRANLNPSLEIVGLLRTMYNAQSMLTRQVSGELEIHFGKKVYQTMIPRNVRLAEAPSYGKPASYYEKNSRGARAYAALADEIINGMQLSTNNDNRVEVVE